jgi:hypothetical protein
MLRGNDATPKGVEKYYQGNIEPSSSPSSSPIETLFMELNVRVNSLVENVDRLDTRLNSILPPAYDMTTPYDNEKSSHVTVAPISRMEIELNSIIEKVLAVNNKLFYITDVLRI